MSLPEQIKAFVLLLLLGICPPSFAKDYIVEMIFFADRDETASNSMHASPRLVIPDLQNAILLDDDAIFHEFIPYPPEELTLVKQATALAKSGRYRVLHHIAWLQPGFTEKDALAVRIHAGKNYSGEFRQSSLFQADSSEPKSFVDQPLNELDDSVKVQPLVDQPLNELDGTVKVVLGRYLHVYTDLVYRQPASVDSTPDASGHSPILADFAVKTHRKMRSKELHYLDHPLLGILVEIRPVELEQEQDQQ